MTNETLKKSTGPFRIHISLLLFFAMVFLTNGCGYKPSSQYIGNVFHEDIYVEVKVSHKEPENAVYVQDALNRMIITRFKGHIVPKEQAESILVASYEGSTFTPMSYDANGYIIRYRANVRVKFDMITKKGKLSRLITSTVESDIEASSVLSSNLRIEAIRAGLAKALDQFLAYASAKGALR